MAISKKELEEIIKAKFPNADFILNDIVGDGDHYSLTIEDNIFNNISLIKQHKIVKDALKEIMQSKLHAITIKTKAKSS